MSATAFAGRRYGCWEVLAVDAVGKRVACRCACGRVQQVALAALQTGESLSCGCSPISREQRRELRDEADLRQRQAALDWRPGR